MIERRRVAAVCWRRGSDGTLEFLLVRTRAGDRWTFPKGGLEPGDASPGEGACREAREEAGVAGAAAAAPLRPYRHRPLPDTPHAPGQLVEAWLVEVTGPAGDPEPGRQPAWFRPDDAAKALAENQPGPEAAAELHAVLAEAVRLLEAGRTV